MVPMIAPVAASIAAGESAGVTMAGYPRQIGLAG